MPALRPLSRSILFLCAVCSAASARADDTERLEAVTALGTPEALPRVGGPLAERTTPQSRLDQDAIRELATPFADYATLVRMTPSFNDSAPNGEGFDAAKNQTLRGFTDGQFNLTVDGIPLQDPDTFQHHSTSYFPAATLDSVIVDRSPGGATDLGYATAGGTIQLNTLRLPVHANTQAYGSVGSFATTLAGVRAASAAPAATGESGLLVNAEHRQTAGALSNSDARRDDVLLKGEWLPAAGFKLTGLFAFDRYHYNNPPSVSQAQLALAGPTAGFGATPGRPDYYGNAATDRRSGFAYARLEGDLGAGWSLDEKLYQHYYASRGLGTVGDTTASPVGAGKGVPATDIALYLTNVDYTTTGNILTFQHDDARGTGHLGVWLEHSSEGYGRYFVDGTTGAFYAGSKAHSPVFARFNSHLDTVQPYLDFEWKASDDLRIRPGVRYQQVRRGFAADVIQKTAVGTPGELTRTVSATLPSLDLNYRLDGNTHLLAEVAKGSQVPSQAYFYTATPGLSNQVHPQTDVAYQLGVVRETDGGRVGLTAYVIHFQDYIATTTRNNVTVSQNSGSVLYRGLEFEGRQEIARGLELLGNASLIRAEYQQTGLVSAAQKAGDDVPLVPAYLAQAGAIYRIGRWQGARCRVSSVRSTRAAAGAAIPPSASSPTTPSTSR